MTKEASEPPILDQEDFKSTSSAQIFPSYKNRAEDPITTSHGRYSFHICPRGPETFHIWVRSSETFYICSKGSDPHLPKGHWNLPHLPKGLWNLPQLLNRFWNLHLLKGLQNHPHLHNRASNLSLLMDMSSDISPLPKWAPGILILISNGDWHMTPLYKRASEHSHWTKRTSNLPLCFCHIVGRGVSDILLLK